MTHSGAQRGDCSELIVEWFRSLNVLESEIICKTKGDVLKTGPVSIEKTNVREDFIVRPEPHHRLNYVSYRSANVFSPVLMKAWMGQLEGSAQLLLHKAC